MVSSSSSSLSIIENQKNRKNNKWLIKDFDYIYIYVINSPWKKNQIFVSKQYMCLKIIHIELPEVKTIVAKMATVACSWRHNRVGSTGFNWW